VVAVCGGARGVVVANDGGKRNEQAFVIGASSIVCRQEIPSES
jgi:hypothetical protein